MEIEFDRLKAAENLRKHGVSFAHAEQAMLDPRAATFEDPDACGEQRWVTVAMDSLSRILIVVHTTRAERTRLISARKASQGEARIYAERI